MSLAILIAYIIGSLVKWDILAWYCTVMSRKIIFERNKKPTIQLQRIFFSVVFGMLLYTMPESPVWLRSKNRFKEAEQSIKWLKLSSHTCANGKSELEMSNTEKTIDEKKSDKSIYLTRPIVMPLIIGLSLLVLQQISGIDAIIFFTVEIFRESGKSSKNFKNSFFNIFERSGN